MPDLSISRQDIMAKQMVAKQQMPGAVPKAGLEFNLDNQKMTVANSLFQTVIKGNINKVRHLLARGVNVNLKNDYGFSPLVAALHIEDQHKRIKMFQLLLEKGASPKVKDTCKTKRPVLHWACVLGQSDQVTTILEESAGDINLNDRDADGLTALHHAVKIGNLPIVSILVDYHVRFGVSVDSIDNLGLTPYIHARRLGYRDVADVLKTKGLASAGHGDKLFRSPREWSQIGKFERKKAIVLENQDRINAFKIMGKVNMIPLIENSPRMAIPGIAIPSFRPDQNAPLSSRKPPHHLSSSLPSLSQAPELENDTRPLSASRQDKFEGGVRDKPGPPRVAFADEQAINSNSSFKSFPSGNQMSNNINANSSMRKINSETTASYVTIPTGNNDQSFTDSVVFKRIDTDGPSKAADRPTFARPIRSNSNGPALNLLQQTTKGRMVSQFHHSEFDKSKASEYKQMLGNITSIMDVLSQQQTKSFRKSVEVKKPETPPKVKKKNKVSTLAIIFGSDGRRKSGRKKKSRSPSNHPDKISKDKSKRGKSPKQKSSGSSQEKSKASAGNSNKLPVPTIKIN